MKKLMALTAGAMLSVSSLAMSATVAQADFTLSILHINDLHSRIEPINRFDSTCSAEDDAEGKCFGGIARVKAKLDERRAALENLGREYIVLDAGDQFQGSLFYSTYKGAAAVEFMNQMGFDAMAVGNHEFDDGPEKLAEFIDKAEFPVISGNTSVFTEPLLKDKLPGYVIVEKGGEKIGVVSVLATDTKETSSPGDNVAFVDEIRYLQSIVPEIESQDVNKIILLSHVGLAKDKEIAAAVDGIDVIVGGHSHTLLHNSDEKAEGKYPVNVANPSGRNVPIVQAYAYSKYLGELRVTFDDDGNVQFTTGNPHILDASVTADAAFAARVAELAAPIEELKKQVVGQTTEPIDGDRNSCRLGECQMGNLVADAMVDRVKDQGVTIAIQNGGGLRASIDGGEITMGEVLTVLPFQNTLATFQLKGADIVAALENGVSQVEEVKGRFPQVSGLRFAWSKEGEAGKDRIKQVQVKDGDGNWTNIDPEATYTVATNNYMRGGGDGYSVFETAGMNAYDFGPGLEQVVADYIAAQGTYTPYTDGRIIEGDGFDTAMVKPEPAATEEAPAATEEAAAMVTDYVIQRGDSLWTIARETYGDATMWKKIEAANDITDLNRMQVGDTIKLPK